MENNDEPQMNLQVLEASIVVTLVCASLSLLISCLVLIGIVKKKIQITFAKEIMIYITISESINSLFKLTLFYKIFGDLKETNSAICGAQIVMFIFTDYWTLINSTVLSIQIYYKFTDKTQWFSQPKNKKICRIIMFTIPMFGTILFSLLHFLKIPMGNNNETEDYWNKYSYIWCWVHPNYSLAIYCSFILMLITIIIYSRKTTSLLAEQKQNLDILIQEDEEEIDSDNKVASENVKYTLKKISYYPIISFFIWFLLFIHRIIEFIFKSKNKNIVPASNPLEFIVMFFHAIVCSSRGIIYGAFYLGYGLYFCKSILYREKPNPLLSED